MYFQSTENDGSIHPAFSGAIAILNVDEEELPPRLLSLLQRLRKYMTHHLNNKLTVVEGNLRYVELMLDRLGELEIDDRELRREIDSIESNLREAIAPVASALKQAKRIKETVNNTLGSLIGERNVDEGFPETFPGEG